MTCFVCDWLSLLLAVSSAGDLLAVLYDCPPYIDFQSPSFLGYASSTCDVILFSSGSACIKLLWVYFLSFFVTCPTDGDNDSRSCLL